MPFKTDEFMAAEFSSRERKVPVPCLGKFFAKNEKPVWKLRNLTGVEIAKADEAASKYALSAEMLAALVVKHTKGVQSTVKKLMGRSDDIPQAIAKRVEHLIICSIEPKCDLDMALKTMQESSEEQIAVVADRETMAFLGCVREGRVMAAYNRVLLESRREERGLGD